MQDAEVPIPYKIPWLAIFLPLAAQLNFSPTGAQGTGEHSPWLAPIFNLPAASNPICAGVATYDSGIPPIENGTTNGAAQFPPEPQVVPDHQGLRCDST